MSSVNKLTTLIQKLSQELLEAKHRMERADANPDLTDDEYDQFVNEYDAIYDLLCDAEEELEAALNPHSDEEDEGW